VSGTCRQGFVFIARRCQQPIVKSLLGVRLADMAVQQAQQKVKIGGENPQIMIFLVRLECHSCSIRSHHSSYCRSSRDGDFSA
jgi:hypothetical protein